MLQTVSMFLAFTSVTLFQQSSADLADSGLVRRLLSSETPQTTPTPSVSHCLISESDGIALIDIPDSDDDEFQIDDLKQRGDKHIDGDMALKWCQAKFGDTSYPMYPYNSNMYDAMKGLCEAKTDQGNGYDCYFGLYRDVENYRKDDTYTADDCEDWYKYDGTVEEFEDGFNISSKFDVNEPTCPWVDPNTLTPPYYDSRERKHCVTYRTQSDSLATTKCHLKFHIICKYDGYCDPEAIVQ